MYRLLSPALYMALTVALSACGLPAQQHPVYPAGPCQPCEFELNGLCVVAHPGAVCRPSVGVCDAPETCDGVRSDCPADARELAGTVCRRSVSSGCDPAEVCDGTSVDCPADVRAADATRCQDNPCMQPGLCGGGKCISAGPTGRQFCAPRPAADDVRYWCILESYCDGQGGCIPQSIGGRSAACYNPAKHLCGTCDAQNKCTDEEAPYYPLTYLSEPWC